MMYISKDNRSINQLTYFRDLFKQIQDKYKYYIYSDYVIALTSSINDIRLRNIKDVELCKIFKEYNMFVGLSGFFENLFELQQYYNEAIEALHYGTKANDGHQVLYTTKEAFCHLMAIKYNDKPPFRREFFSTEGRPFHEF